ncbi:type IV secretion system protein [Acinetobacter baumannii]|jgi:type IV secretion system protein VirB6|uniref:type IV secretion system protein n=1 Tax=Acinetobacter baumannii TaxID=470 RepID=UPI002341BA02|nr:type IV secretion system protein [Acinetobacter baumannii]MDC4147468.1 type IV secretion system protein [Acinetobacter baumannii]
MAYTVIPIFEPIFTKIDTTLVSVLGSKASAIVSLISPLVGVAFATYVLLVVMSFWRDNQGWDAAALDMVKRIAAWGVILSASVNIGWYMSNVVPFINAFPVELSNAVTGNGASDNINSIDSIISYYISVVQETWSNASGIQASLVAAFNIALLLITGIPVVIVMAAYLLLVKLMIAILIVIGPLFLAMALFPITRQYATLWIGQVVNFGLLAFFMNVTAVLMINILLGLQVDPATASLVELMSYGVVALLFWVVVLRVPDLAAALSGGMAGNGFGAAVSSARNATKLGQAIGKAMQGSGSGGGRNTMKSESSGR